MKLKSLNQLFQLMPILLVVIFLIAYYYPVSICISKELWGFECGFCGATRAVIAFHQLNWHSAILLNPFVFFILLSLWLISIINIFAYFSKIINKISNNILNFLYNNFFIVFGLCVFLYLLQYLMRIIFY